MAESQFISSGLDILCQEATSNFREELAPSTSAPNAEQFQVQRNEQAQYIRSQRISESTRKTYTCYIKRFTEFINANHPNLVDSAGDIKLGSLSVEILDNFFTELKSKKRGREDQRASVTVLNTCRSSIRCLFIDRQVPVPEWFDKDLTSLFQGLKKVEARTVRLGLKPEDEGKLPLSFSLYKFLMLRILKTTLPNAFAHLFAIMSWNLMTRGDNTADINIRNMRWYEDCLQVKLGHAKNDQCGELSASVEPKHVYSNPIVPEICPILSLGLYLSTSFNAPNETCLFIGTRQKDRMLETLGALLRYPEVVEFISTLGYSAKDYGNHSFRKGAATYVAAGSVGGPPIVSVIRRAGWSLGDVLGRYLKADPAGDQYCGRVVAGLPINSHRFACSPPRIRNFDSNINIRRKVLETINHQFPNASSHPHFIPVLYHSLASLVYHQDFLKDTLLPSHPLFNTHLFSSGVLANDDLVAEVNFGDLESSTLTGIPPHVSQLVYINKVLTSSNPGNIVAALKEFFLERELAPTSTVTVSNLQHTLASFKEDLLHAFQNQQPQASQLVPESNNTSTFWTLSKTGKYSRLPDNFCLPAKCSLEIALRLWYLGNPAKRVSALCKVESSDLQSRQQKKTLSEWRVVVKHLMEQLKLKGVSIPDNMTNTEQGVSQLYKKLFEHNIISSTKKGKKTSRMCQKSVLSIAKQIRKHNT